MGLKQGLEQVVDAARLAAERATSPSASSWPAAGARREALRAMGAGLPTLDFLPVQPDAIHASLLAAADVLLLSERATQTDMSLPSKLTGYFAAGRPIVAAVPSGGPSAVELERAGAGVVVPAGDPTAILDALASLRSGSRGRGPPGRRGPTYAAAHLSAAACLARAAALVEEIAA